MGRRRLFWLFLSVGLAALFGAAVRIVFSPQQLQTWLKARLQQDLVEFSAQTMELSLARGAIPHVALRVATLRVVENDSCLRNTVWRINEVFFPLQISALLKGEVKLGKIVADTIDVTVGNFVTEGSCFRPQAINPLPVVPTKDKKNSRQPQAETKRSAKHLLDLVGGIVVKSFSLRHQERPGAILRASDVAVTPQDVRIIFGSDLTLETEAVHELAWPVIHVGGEVGQQVEVVFNGRWQEGIVNLIAKLDRSSPEKLSLKGQIKHLPLANFLKIYEQVNGQKVGSYPRSMWLTCELGLDSKVTELKDAVLSLRDCLVEGDAGTWESSNLNYDLNQGVFREPFEIRVSHLPLKTLLGILQMDVLDGVLNQYGRLSGNVVVDAPGKMAFEGFLDDVEIYFSNQGIQAHQGLKKARIQVDKHDGRISGLLSEVEMRKGSFKGSISLNFDKRFQDGYVQLQVSELLLDPSVQELLVKEKLGRIETYGKFKIANGRFDVFKGDLGVDSLENQNLKIKTFKSSISYMGQTVTAHLSAKLLAINPNSESYNLIRPLFLDKKFADSWVELADIGVNLSGYRQYLEWKRGRAQAPAERALFSSEGIWQEGAGLAGWISVDFPSLKLLRWDVSGEVLNPRLLPSSQWLKELVKEKPTERPRAKK